MFVKMLPGIGIAVVLGLAFSLTSTPRTTRAKPGPKHEVTLPRFSAQAVGQGGQVVAVASRQVQPFEMDSPKAANIALVTAQSKPFAPAAQMNELVPMHSHPAPALPDNNLLMAASAVTAPRQSAEAVQVQNVPSPAQSASTPGGTGSHSALASVPACTSSANTCPDPPDKGIYVWGNLLYSQEKYGQNPGKYTAYDMDSTTVTLGFMKDWSPTTRLGLSVDLLDAEVKSAHPGDTFKNDVTGWVLNADVSTAIDKFNIDGKILYGQPEAKGSGLAGGFNREEAKHKSTLYGFSGKVGIPLKFGDSIKLAPAIGIHYRKLKSKAYDYTLNGAHYSAVSQDSKSLAVPLTVALKKDFEFCAGKFTPRIMVGAIREFKDTALGFRTYNASAASYTSPTGMVDKGPTWIYQAGVGMDLATHNGWNISLDYMYYKGGDYSNDSLNLGIGKCF